MSSEPRIAPAPDEAHLSTCRSNHNDLEKRLHPGATRCNGLLQSGERCSNRALTPVNPEYLPVCGTHKKQAQAFKVGQCTAVASCGFRCERICPWKSSMNHACSEHEDSLPCYLNRLPIELRFAIMEFLIPAGPVPTDANREVSYAAVASLARVNKETAQHLDVLFYQNAKTRCEIFARNLYVRAARNAYGLHLGITQVDNASHMRSVFDLHRAGLGQFTHYDIRICEDPCSRTGLLCTIRHIFSAIRAAFSDSSTNQTRKPVLTIVIETSVYLYTDEDDTLITAIRRAQHIVGLIKQYEVVAEWTILMKLFDRPADMRVEVTKNSFTIHNEHPSKPEQTMSRLRWAVESLRFSAWATPSQDEVVRQREKWRRYEKLIATIHDLLVVNYVTITRFEYSSDLIRAFDKCFELRDMEHFKSLCKLVKLLWASFLNHRQRQITHLKSRFNGATSALDHKEPLKDVLSTIPVKMEFPKLRSACWKTVNETAEKWRTMLGESIKDRGRVEWAAYRRVMDKDSFHPTSGNTDTLAIYRQCAQAAARVRQGQQMLPWVKPRTNQIETANAHGERTAKRSTWAACALFATGDGDFPAGLIRDADIRDYF